MRSIVFLALIFIPALLFSQPKELKNKILWDENHPLIWKDFKGPVNKKSSYNAVTTSGVYYQADPVSENEISVNVYTCFDPKKSWKKKKNMNDDLLKHEQNHFDLSEVYARLLRKKLSGLEPNTAKNIYTTIKQEFSQKNKEIKTISQQYDKETDHGGKKEQQDMWNNKVKALLAETKDYNSNPVKIKVIPSQGKK
jgi:hypothetical protein